MYQPDETTRIEVRLDDDTVWLTQQQMAELFATDRTSIGRHIGNIYGTDELEEVSTCAKIAQVPPVGQQGAEGIPAAWLYCEHPNSSLGAACRRDAGVSAIIYTRPLSAQQHLDVRRHNQQYAPITVNICQRNHDRFLIIDDAVYVFGASLKDAGKRLFAYIRMQETDAQELLDGIR
jgi:hypothetical protein